MVCLNVQFPLENTIQEFPVKKKAALSMWGGFACPRLLWKNGLGWGPRKSRLFVCRFLLTQQRRVFAEPVRKLPCLASGIRNSLECPSDFLHKEIPKNHTTKSRKNNYRIFSSSFFFGVMPLTMRIFSNSSRSIVSVSTSLSAIASRVFLFSLRIFSARL